MSRALAIVSLLAIMAGAMLYGVHAYYNAQQTRAAEQQFRELAPCLLAKAKGLPAVAKILCEETPS